MSQRTLGRNFVLSDFVLPAKTARFVGNVAEKPPFPTGKARFMWRVGLLLTVFLGFAIPAAQAAHLKRATCVEQDFALCNLDRSAPGYSAQKPSRSHTQRAGTKSRTGKDAASSVGYARAAASPDAKPLAPTAPVQMLGARNFDPLAGGSEELTAPRAQRETDPWLQPILLVLAGTGILSLFVAKAAEL